MIAVMRNAGAAFAVSGTIIGARAGTFVFAAHHDPPDEGIYCVFYGKMKYNMRNYLSKDKR